MIKEKWELAKGLFRKVPYFLGGLQSEEKKVTYDRLSCGAKLITRRVPGMPNAETLVIVEHAGSGQEIHGNFIRGTAHYLEHICATYSKDFPNGSADEVMDRIGGRSNAATNVDCMKFTAWTPYQNWEKSIEVISAAVCRPDISAHPAAFERGIVRGEYLRNMSSVEKDILPHQLVPWAVDNPYFAPPIGVYRDLARLTEEAALRFHKTKFNAATTTVLFQESIPHDKVKAKFEQVFSLPVLAQPASYPEIVLVGGDIRQSKGADASGTRCALLFPECGKTPIDLLRMYAFRAVMFQKIFCSFRRETGAYDPGLSVVDYRPTSFFCADYCVEEKKVKVSLDAIGSTLTRIAQEGAPEELHQQRERLIRNNKNCVLNLSRKLEVVAEDERRYGKSLSSQEIHDMSLAISNEDIKKVAREILSHPYTFAAQGKLTHVPSPERVQKLLRMQVPPARIEVR